MNDDWRLNGQEEYLTGVTLVRRRYERNATNPEWNHDHCEFCGAKFMINGEHESLAEGYATHDQYRWICDGCFSDFRERFAWTVVPSGAV